MSQTVEQLQTELNQEIKDLKIEIEDLTNKVSLLKKQLEQREELKVLLSSREYQNK